jgi:hypothetical protein
LLDVRELLSGLHENLDKIGVNATLLERYSTEAIGEGNIRWLSAVYDVNEGPLHIGSIKITGGKIDQIQLFSRIVPSDVGAFRWYDIHFCIVGNVKGKSKDLIATIKDEKNAEKLKWVGAGLAERLNSDAELKTELSKFGLWRFYGDLHPASSVRVSPDEKYGCTRIVFRMDRETSRDTKLIISKTIESLKIAEKIAQQIRILLG